MEKINFNQVRGFSDSITLTFNFIKQEFKPAEVFCGDCPACYFYRIVFYELFGS